MPLNLTPLNSQQKIQEVSAKGAVTTIGSTQVIIYTVPAGKKAEIKAAAFESNGGGANTVMTARININSLFDIPITNETVARDAAIFNNQELDAGDTINIVGDSPSNNGAAEFTITLRETPA